MLTRPANSASYPVPVRRVATLLHASFRPRLATTPLRFANPSPPSGWVEDFHLQADIHARHTLRRPASCRERVCEEYNLFALPATTGGATARGVISIAGPTSTHHHTPLGRAAPKRVTASNYSELMRRRSRRVWDMTLLKAKLPCRSRWRWERVPSSLNSCHFKTEITAAISAKQSGRWHLSSRVVNYARGRTIPAAASFLRSMPFVITLKPFVESDASSW